MNEITARADMAEWMIGYGKYEGRDVLPKGPRFVEELLMDIWIRDAIRRPGRDPARYVPCAEHCIRLWENWIADLICGDEEGEE